MAIITMMVYTRGAGYSPGIYEVEDSPTVRWLLKSDKFELIDPPDLAWLDNPELEVEAANGYRDESDNQAAEPSVISEPVGGSGLGEESTERTQESPRVSAPSKRGPRKFPADRKDNS